MNRMQTLRGLSAGLAPVVLLTALFAATPFHAAWAQVAPTLGAAEGLAVLGATTVTNTGPTVIITGDLGVDPGTSVTGFPPGSLTAGSILGPGGVAHQAQFDATAAYVDLAGQSCPVSNTFGVPTDLAGMTLVPGVYCFASSAGLTGALTLDALGNPNAVWVFQIPSTLITGTDSTVQVINGGNPCNVFWQVGSSATLNAGTTFVGNILALTSITLRTNADVSGRVLARNGAVTMDTNTVDFTACNVPPVTTIRPTLGKAFSPNVITAGGTSTLTITLTNPDASNVASSVSLTDTLPSGVVINGVASTTCGSGSVTTGTSWVTLAGGSIPANGSCVVTVQVTAADAGSYINSMAAGALQTSNGSNAAPAAATLTALLSGTSPGLSLNKTADPTTYTSVGQVIVYTYVVTNIGNTTLTGPFTVTDDKLGSFTCGTGSAAPGASLTCTMSYTIKASDLSATSLPTNVTAKINTGAWLASANSTQATKITGAGPGVPNGTYPCWCIQDYVPNDLHNQRAKLYSTIGDSLPGDVASLAWGKVNYVLNHKVRGKAKSDLAFLKDVQTAIWVLLGEPNPEFGISVTARQMITAANAHADFVPGPGDVVAVIVYSDGMTIRPNSIQESICEMKHLKSIVNHATARNAVVRSGQAQATVKQVK